MINEFDPPLPDDFGKEDGFFLIRPFHSDIQPYYNFHVSSVHRALSQDLKVTRAGLRRLIPKNY